MSSIWIKSALKYALLLMPTAFLAALIGIVATGTWVTAVLRDPSRFDSAPVLIQKLTRAAYWHTRKHWHTVPECVLFDPELLYRPRPGSCVFENAEFRVTMHFDPRGARVTPAPVADVADSRPRPRVVVIGDSHAMGWGVEDRDTFASLLASEHGFTTLNLAVSSYGTARELKWLGKSADLRPDDVLVIQYSNNDYPENRHFAQHGSVGPYQEAELQRLFAYRPTAVEPLPVAGLLLRLLTNDVQALLTRENHGDSTAGTVSPSSAFLRVLEAYPQLKGRQIVVVAINGPGQKTHLSALELRQAGLPLLEPDLTDEDFLDIDDHMRPRGHRKVTAMIAALLERAPAGEVH